MTLLDAQLSSAEQLASANFAANLGALRAAGRVELAASADEPAPAGERVFARDGALSCRDAGGRWLSGCSVPRRAAEATLRKLEVKGSVGCFLAPPHAQHLRAALERMRPEQAVIAIVPEPHELRGMLHCHDFAEHIAAHRLWFVAGPQWKQALNRLFDALPGLATPAQFIRVGASDEAVVEALIRDAQQVFSDVTARRSAALSELHESQWQAPQRPRLCVVAPTRFRLWNDLGAALLGAAQALPHECFDADDPTCGTPLCLAAAVRRCGMLLTANTARSDLPGVLPEDLPWLTWLTAPRIPNFSAAGPRDHLLLADPAQRAAAAEAGWPDDRLHIAGWPALQQTADRARGGDVAIIADTRALAAPEELREYSSHELLWNAIAEELVRDPLSLGDASAFLEKRMRSANIGADGFPRSLFTEHLIVPAYQRGIAQLLADAGEPLRLWGRGWDQIAPLKRFAAGPVESREALAAAVRGSRVLVHVWPTAGTVHPIGASGAAVVRPQRGQRPSEFIAALRDTKPAEQGACAPRLDGDLLSQVLRRI